MTSRDIREVGCFALFSTSEVVENRTNGPLKPVLLRGSSTTSFMWSFGWLTRLGSPFLKIFWPDISKNSKIFQIRQHKAHGRFVLDAFGVPLRLTLRKL